MADNLNKNDPGGDPDKNVPNPYDVPVSNINKDVPNPDDVPVSVPNPDDIPELPH